MSDCVSIEGLDKAEVLAALYNASRPQGMGFMHYDPAPMEREEAAALLEGRAYFDYLKGRMMKVDLSGDGDFNPWGYDRDNGVGAAQRVIDALRSGEASDGLTVSHLHSVGKGDAIRVAREALNEETVIERNGETVTITLGLAGVTDVLAPKIDEAEDD